MARRNFRFFISIILPLCIFNAWATKYYIAPPEPYVTGAAIGHENLMPPTLTPKQKAQFIQSVYVEGHYGRGFMNWRAANSGVNFTSEEENEQVFGFDMGYRYKWVAVELGGLSSLRQFYEVAGSTPINFRQFVIYLGLRLYTPMWHGLKAFIKTAGGYLNINVNISSIPKTLDRLRGVFGGGVMYYITPSFTMQAQYLYLMGNDQFNGFGALVGTSFNVPAENIVTVGLGYEFYF